MLAAMARRLLPCPSCSRHVNLDEAKCPFCAQIVHFAQVPAAVSVAQTARLSRTARVALGAALAAALPACGGSGQPADGPEPPPATTTAPPDDDGSPAAEYGAPMPPDDPGAVAPLYGEPAPPDDDGAGAPEYGAPPEH